MASSDSESVAVDARRLYEETQRTVLEENHMNEFVAIEPVSGEYFLAQTLSEAIGRHEPGIRTAWHPQFVLATRRRSILVCTFDERIE